MRHVVYYQNKSAQFEMFADAYTFCCFLIRDNIEYDLRLESIH